MILVLLYLHDLHTYIYVVQEVVHMVYMYTVAVSFVRKSGSIAIVVQEHTTIGWTYKTKGHYYVREQKQLQFAMAHPVLLLYTILMLYIYSNNPNHTFIHGMEHGILY